MIKLLFFPFTITLYAMKYLFVGLFNLYIFLLNKLIYYGRILFLKIRLFFLNKDIEKQQKEIDEMKERLNDILDDNKYSEITSIDNLDGLEFEEYTCELLKNNGFNNVIKTKASGDFGIDVLAEQNGIKYAIQCKNYTSPLSNKCVQEAYSGKQYYNCHIGVVLTNSTFTQHARDLAEKNGILLWDRDKLISLMTSAKKYKEINNHPTTENNIDDTLYEKIKKIVIKKQRASISLLQSEFKLGYSQARMFMELLEKDNIIGAVNGDDYSREVLIKSNE